MVIWFPRLLHVQALGRSVTQNRYLQRSIESRSKTVWCGACPNHNLRHHHFTSLSRIMSSQTQYSSAPFHSSDNNIVKDIVLWRKKNQSAAVLIAATATWMLMQVYQFNFVTVASWIAIFGASSLFLFANMLKILGKEPPSLSGLELSEQTALEMANTVRAWIEEGIRWMFRVSAEGDWPLFVGVVAVLWLISCVGSCVDFLTFIYIGIVVSMTVPVTYMKEEHRIKSWMAWLKAKCKKAYEMFDERSQRTIKKIKDKVAIDGEEKEKRTKTE